MKGRVLVVETNQRDRCVKYNLPDGGVLDILADVFEEIGKWIQLESNSPESGGYIVGYQHENTNNISLERVSNPGIEDVSSRGRFSLKDPKHYFFLTKQEMQKSFYMGVWHTHPEDIPTPSSIDWNDWTNSVKLEQSGSKYIFFVIAGRKETRIWAGDTMTGKIVELDECKKTEGIYMK